MKLRQPVRIKGQDVGLDKKVTNKALIEYFSDITMYHGFLEGHTSDQGTSPVSWIVMGWKMQVLKRAEMFNDIEVETWIQSYTKIRARRNYAIYNKAGELIVKAAAVWVAMDGEKGTFCRLTKELMEPFGTEPEQNFFPEYQFPDIRNFTLPKSGGLDVKAISSENPVQQPADTDKYSRPADTDGKSLIVKPLLQMMDYNNHVHNSEYLNLADEILPEQIREAKPDNVEVIYRSQIVPGECVKLDYSFADNIHYVAVRNPEDQSLHALVRVFF